MLCAIRIFKERLIWGSAKICVFWRPAWNCLLGTRQLSFLTGTTEVHRSLTHRRSMELTFLQAYLKIKWLLHFWTTLSFAWSSFFWLHFICCSFCVSPMRVLFAEACQTTLTRMHSRPKIFKCPSSKPNTKSSPNTSRSDIQKMKSAYLRVLKYYRCLEQHRQGASPCHPKWLESKVIPGHDGLASTARLIRIGSHFICSFYHAWVYKLIAT